MNTARLTFCGLRRISVIVAGLVVLPVCMLTGTIFAQGKENEVKIFQQAQEIFQPLPKVAAAVEFPLTPDRVSLGHKLFFDPRISSDGIGSCVRCHQPALYGTDGLPRSRGINESDLFRNAPTILNAALQFKAHWDGYFETVEGQAKQSLVGPGFGNSDHFTAMSRIKAIPGYLELFRKAFPGEGDPVNAENWGRAIGAYERTLITPSTFDEYLGGNIDALSDLERKGLKRFVDTGCIQCHEGAGVGGSRFEKFGITTDYYKETGSAEIDQGRFTRTNNPADLYQFKVAGLRNVVMTAPYFHDGSVATLPKAIQIMAKVQLGKELKDDEAAEIVAFLGSLTGKLPDDFANAPALPPAPFGVTPAVAKKAAPRVKPKK